MTDSFIKKMQEEAKKLYRQYEVNPEEMNMFTAQIINKTCEEILRQLPDKIRKMTDGKHYRGVVTHEEVEDIINNITASHE